MIQNKFGELIFNEQDLVNLLMQGRDPASFNGMLVDSQTKISWPADLDQTWPDLRCEVARSCTPQEFHSQQQKQWHMPEHYRTLDIAKHVLDLCDNEAQLQRVGHELLLYQERGLFDLLRYLKYLVDVMQSNNIIWGLGRGSSVASYVLYKLGVHRIDSMYYELNVEDFLR